MIRGIHYFGTELKTKIDVIPRGCFNLINPTGYDLINYYPAADLLHVLFQ